MLLPLRRGLLGVSADLDSPLPQDSLGVSGRADLLGETVMFLRVLSDGLADPGFHHPRSLHYPWVTGDLLCLLFALPTATMAAGPV